MRTKGRGNRWIRRHMGRVATLPVWIKSENSQPITITRLFNLLSKRRGGREMREPSAAPESVQRQRAYFYQRRLWDGLLARCGYRYVLHLSFYSCRFPARWILGAQRNR
jgi:hypothetical protein